MTIFRGVRHALAGLLLALLAVGQASAAGEPGYINLCVKYGGRAAFVEKGATIYITCDWIKRIARDAGSLLVMYRSFLADASTVDKLKSGAVEAPDMDCRNGVLEKIPEGQRLSCRDTGSVGNTYVFVADAGGALKRVTFRVDLRKMYTDAWNKAVADRALDEVFPGWVNLQIDLQKNLLRETASMADSVVIEGDVATVTVTAP